MHRTAHAGKVRPRTPAVRPSYGERDEGTTGRWVVVVLCNEHSKALRLGFGSPLWMQPCATKTSLTAARLMCRWGFR